jgi:hypothetical protein
VRDPGPGDTFARARSSHGGLAVIHFIVLVGINVAASRWLAATAATQLEVESGAVDGQPRPR